MPKTVKKITDRRRPLIIHKEYRRSACGPRADSDPSTRCARSGSSRAKSRGEVFRGAAARARESLQPPRSAYARRGRRWEWGPSAMRKGRAPRAVEQCRRNARVIRESASRPRRSQESGVRSQEEGIRREPEAPEANAERSPWRRSAYPAAACSPGVPLLQSAISALYQAASSNGCREATLATFRSRTRPIALKNFSVIQLMSNSYHARPCRADTGCA
jgi:hypothetical protein